jgi:hypothetical protein
MITLILTYFVVVVAFGALLYYLARSGLVVLSYAIISVIAFFGLVDTLGTPAPVRFATEGEVIARYADPSKGIYLWIVEDGEPRAFHMPWDAVTAERVEVVMREHRRGFFQPSSLTIHPPPHPPEPLKNDEG